MLTRWPDVNVRAAGIAIFEQRQPVEHRRGGDAVEAGKHSTITQDADIVERRLDSREHFANWNSVRSIDVTLRCLFPWEGCRGGKGPATVLCGRSPSIASPTR